MSSIDSKLTFIGLNSNRAGDHQSSYNTAEFTYEDQNKEDTTRRKEIRYQKLRGIGPNNEAKEKSDKNIEILNYYNRSMSSEVSNENTKENRMLKDALYATIKLVLDQNKQIKKLKQVVTSNNPQTSQYKTSEPTEESRLTDMSLLSIGKDAINPIITVNNFLKEHVPKKKGKSQPPQKKDKKDLSHISQNIESIDETLLQELGKKILKESIKLKTDAEKSTQEVKNNDRYCDNSYMSNGYSFITNKNLLNTSMSPIHKANPNF